MVALGRLLVRDRRVLEDLLAVRVVSRDVDVAGFLVSPELHALDLDVLNVRLRTRQRHSSFAAGG